MTGEQLRARRLRLGLTRTALAAYLGVSFWTLAQWENGRRGISMDDFSLRTALATAEKHYTESGTLPDWRKYPVRLTPEHAEEAPEGSTGLGQGTDDSTEGVGQ